MRTQEETLSFEDLLNQTYGRDEILEGEIVSAIVLAINNDFISVDIGYKSEGVISASEFLSINGSLQIKIGDRIDVMVESREDESGRIILSKDKADRIKTWDKISIVHNSKETISGIVIGKIKGGLQVDIGVRAFLPGSQADLRPIRNLDKMIGERLQFQVIKFNRKRGNIVLSRRAVLEKEREEKRGTILQHLSEGTIVEGIIKNMTDYGAFVDLGGIDGLLHITDMSWGRIQNPSELFQIGDTVKVKVLKYDSECGRVSLGIKQIQEDPWLSANYEFSLGTHVSGKIVSMTDYGAFVELKPGVEGLIHISEMSWSKRLNKRPSNFVSIGDRVNAVVLGIDQENKRISLGMKQIEPNPWISLGARYPIGTVIRGKVRNITDFGIFVSVEDGVDGLVHISDLSWTHRVKHPSEIFKKGDIVEAVALNIDVESERFSLGIKQLNEDPWSRVSHVYPRGSRVKGRVSKITDFGAFIEIEPGIDGLCHISEFNDEHIHNPYEFIKPGDEVEVVIIDIDSNERKVALSMKATKKDEADYRSYLAKTNSPISKSHSKIGSGMGTLGEALKGFNVQNDK